MGYYDAGVTWLDWLCGVYLAGEWEGVQSKEGVVNDTWPAMYAGLLLQGMLVVSDAPDL